MASNPTPPPSPHPGTARSVAGGSRPRLEAAVCARCACFCDDLVLACDGDTLRPLENACSLGEAWLREARPLAPAALGASGAPLSLDEAVEKAAERLRSSRAPLVLGLGGLSLEAAREASLLARALEAPLLRWPPAPPPRARQGLDAPEHSATLGEVQATADLVIFLRADPVSDAPRHLERYSRDPPLLSGATRRVVLVERSEEVQGNRTAAAADLVIRLGGGTGGASPELDLALRLAPALAARTAAAPGSPPPRTPDAPPPEAPPEEALAALLSASRHAHIVLGATAARDEPLVATLSEVAARARRSVRVTLGFLDPPGDWRATEEASTWIDGAPPPLLRLRRPPDPGRSSASAAPDAPRSEWVAGLVDGLVDGRADGRADVERPPGWLGEPEAADLALLAGLDVPGTDLESPLHPSVPVISLDRRARPGAELAFVVPGLDPRLRATVVRADGVLLTLDGGGVGVPGIPDPAAGVLRALRERLEAFRAGPPPEALGDAPRPSIS